MELDGGRLERAFGVVEHFVQEGSIPGAVILVGTPRDVHGPRAYGWASLQPMRRPMQEETLFDLASLTKVVATAALAWQLLDQGRIRLDDPVSLFLPGYGAHDRGPSREWKEQLTLRHLLTHTSGISGWEPLYRHPGSPADRLQQLLRYPLLQPPGERVVYSCLGYILLGWILEVVAGAPLDQLARERLYQPLGMEATGFVPAPDLRERAAATELAPDTGEVLQGVVHDENARFLGGVAGNAGLFGTARDLAAFALEVLKALRGEPALWSPAVVRLATRSLTPGKEEERGLGWQIHGGRPFSSAGDLFSPASFGHTGFTGTSLWIDPERELFAVLLTNRVHPSRDNQAHLRLRPLFHNAVAAAAVGGGAATG
ncbi:serine hydrolase domain-containing protein [Limnochorda pilosa]|uniref:Beta-lactamase n=1 Tax=Limnochorda pilosa TaxID=1555112 RepID=A0A0K2SN75_LIMPI|nr:serine hydrolase domain-containing protein [Limnochorda pilosa]BAS28269.1 beta-lactamase [Limnochorda pilosa]